jgi:hypothetical protein
VGLGKYLKTAFANRWNLLVFLGGMGFALLSGHADVALPLVLAGEIGYLGFLGTHPKFQKYVEAQEAKAARSDGQDVAAQAARRMLFELPKPLEEKFQAIKQRCTDLRQLARQMRDPDQASREPLLEDAQLAGLDRLLWMYLRLLYTQYSLAQFLKKTSAAEIDADIRKLEQKLQGIGDDPNDLRQQRLRKVVEDNLQTSRARVANYRKAEENYELMTLEIDRLENTIHSLSELAVNRQEPEFISGQIDQVTSSMVQTEKTMGELAFVTGMQLANEERFPESMFRMQRLFGTGEIASGPGARSLGSERTGTRRNRRSNQAHLLIPRRVIRRASAAAREWGSSAAGDAARGVCLSVADGSSSRSRTTA